MIECSNERIFKKNRYKSSRRFFSFFIFALIFALLIGYGEFVIKRHLDKLCNNYFNSQLSVSSNLAIRKSIDGKVDYSDLVVVEKNSSGDIVLMSVNTLSANSIAREIQSNTYEIMSDKINDGVPVSLFSFLGLSFLSGYGPFIDYKVMTVTKIECGFRSNFSSVGINQTLHSVYIVIECEANTTRIFNNESIVSATEVLVCESVLVGKVPEIYLNGKLFG